MASARPVRADGVERATATLEWKRLEGGDSCASAAQLQKAVERRWKRRIFVDGRADLVVAGTIGPSDGGWSVDLAMRSPDGRDLGTRTLTTRAPHCSSLDDSLALAVGLMLDVSAERLRSEQAGADGDPIQIPDDTHPPRAPWRYELGAGVAGSLGVAPGFDPGLFLSFAFEPPGFWLFELDGVLWMATEAEAEGQRASFSTWTATLSICPLRLGSPELRAHVCLRQRVGSIRSEGVDFSENRTADDLIVTVGPSLRASMALVGPLGLIGAVGADLPLARKDFVYRDSSGQQREIHRMSPVAGSARIGLRAQF